MYLFSHLVRLQDKIASPSHQISLPLVETNTVIAWPKFNGSQESCLCYSQFLNNCSCFSTGNPFNVTRDNQNVYWHNLKNGTIILFIDQTVRFGDGILGDVQFIPVQRIFNAFRVINPSKMYTFVLLVYKIFVILLIGKGYQHLEGYNIQVKSIVLIIVQRINCPF